MSTRRLASLVLAFASLFVPAAASTADAQPQPPAPSPPDPGGQPPPGDPERAEPVPSDEPPSAPPPEPPIAPVAPRPIEPPPSEEEPRPREERPRMSEGRAIVAAYNTGFHWAIAPGVVFVDGNAGFSLGLRFGYGFDTGSVIVVPGIQGAGYFTDPNVFTGVPLLRLVFPIDRFAPFVEGGAGVGHVASTSTVGSQDGVALLAGAGFMLHFSVNFGLGVEGSYQVITGTDFKGFGIGPVLAIGF